MWGVGAAIQTGSLFATITRTESERLQRLTSGLGSVEDTIARLGKPDGQDVSGTTIVTPATRREPPSVTTYRTLRFSKLSETADVIVIDYGPKGVSFSFQGKSLKKRATRRNGARKTSSSAGRRSKRSRRSL